jgi:4-amino-4-deoxy-L-arabinose transferase-like glycosyltransferase
LVPLKRATDIPSKPPLFHWSAAVTARTTSKLNEATIRFPSAAYATVGVLLVYFLGRKLFGPEVALLGGAILATTMVYQNQAVSARVDMTFCFFVTLSLVLFYAVYCGYLTHQVWYYAFYGLAGIGTLAKGPLGILLPALVIGVSVVLNRRWDLLSKFCFHPGVVLTLLLGAGWYGIAVTRGEGFFDHQIVQENLNRFFGGSGHSHPVHYYIPYLFAQGLPWSLFLPFLLWDSVKKESPSEDGTLFLKLWFLVMVVFFSLSIGKRPVYLLPLYPALSLLMAAWIYNHGESTNGRLFLYRIIATTAGAMGVLLVIIALGSMWNHDPGWFLFSHRAVLKAKDRANLLLVKTSLVTFGWPFAILSLVSSLLWLSLAGCVWGDRFQSGAHRLVLISIMLAFAARVVVMPIIVTPKAIAFSCKRSVGALRRKTSSISMETRSIATP